MGDAVAGWIDFDRGARAWLDDTKVNIGFALDPKRRGGGVATRALLLLVEHLRDTTDVATATLLIEPVNEASLAVARRAGFLPTDAVDGEILFERHIER